MLLVQIPTELQRALEDYCKDSETTPNEVISDLLAGLLLPSDCIIVEDTGLSVYDIINAFCTLLDGTQIHKLGLTSSQVELISHVRASVHDIWIEGKL
jgi:hypothetical protein